MFRLLGKRATACIMCAVMVLGVTACGKDKTDDASEETSTSLFETVDESGEAVTEEKEEKKEEEESDGPYTLPEGMYFSEITGEPISEEIKDQRPIAVMVDNEKKALPHYGTSEADVVYEIMNSTKNDRITRLMCIVKDWGKIEQMGSIRSTRPTNILLAAEWNALLCHDGGPFYNDQYFSQDWANHFSGGFTRVQNGKATEFTEYILNGDLEDRFEEYKNDELYSKTYNKYANEGNHFNFTEYGNEVKLDKKYDRSYKALAITLPFPHNTSKLVYNPDTKEYEYYEYGSRHEDAEDGEPMSFKNVILQKCTFSQLDENGYLIYNCIDSGQYAWYCTNGVCKDCTWVKPGETGVTRFYDENGDELEINTGKTYIALIPDDTWEKTIFE